MKAPIQSTHIARFSPGAARLALAISLLACGAAMANGTAQALVDGQGLTGGSEIYPDIPASAWTPFLAEISVGTTDTITGDTVDQMSVEVVLPATTGHTFLKNRVPSVVYRFSGNATELSQPMDIVWPNVLGYGPGEAHLVIAYDPSDSSWLICGSAVVSADGLTLVQSSSTYNTVLSDYYIDDAVILTLPGGGS